jgi:hypothetical protein
VTTGDRDELRQQIDDLTALKHAMRHRQTLERFSPQWHEAVRLEEGLMARIRAWSHPIGRNHD